MPGWVRDLTKSKVSKGFTSSFVCGASCIKNAIKRNSMKGKCLAEVSPFAH